MSGDWCAEHKREKPCSVCAIAARGFKQLLARPDLLRPVINDVDKGTDDEN